jgi:hypothetical protein
MSGAVGAVGSAPPVVPTGAGAAGVAGAGALLPEGAPLSGVVLNDAMSALYVMLSQQRQLGMEAGKNRVDDNQKLRDQALADERAALQRQKANEADSGRGFFGSIGHLLGDVVDDAVHLRVERTVTDAIHDTEDAWNSPAFWNDLEKGALAVAKVAAVVASVAVTAATLGAGAPVIAVAALALSLGGEVVSDTRVFGDGASKWVGMCMEGAGAALSLGGTLAVSGASVAARTLATVGAVAMTTSGAADVVAGGAHIRNGDFAANAQQASADAEAARQRGERMDELTKWIVDELKDDDKSHERALQTLQGAMQTNDQTAVLATSVPLKG